MFISIGFYREIEDELVKVFNNDQKKMDDYYQELAKGFAAVLRVTRDQIRAVFSREGIVHLDVAFLIIFEKEKFHTEIFAFPIEDAVPTEKDRIVSLFPLFEFGKDIVIPCKNMIPYVKDGYIYAMEAGQRLAADFGREGLPTDMKKFIAELAKIFKKAHSPKYYPYPHWVNV